jgi:hypothetical protein
VRHAQRVVVAADLDAFAAAFARSETKMEKSRPGRGFLFEGTEEWPGRWSKRAASRSMMLTN